MITLRRMEYSDVETAASFFAHAFQNGALYRYFEPNAEKRPAFLRMIFVHRLQHNLDKHDGVFALLDGMPAGAAIWQKPETHFSNNTALQEAVIRYDENIFYRWEHFHSILFPMLSNVCDTPHWELAPIAVLPELQGRGVAREIINVKCKEIDASGLPCILATLDKANIRIYERHGFKIATTTHIAGDLYCYAMIRQGSFIGAGLPI